MPKPTTGTGSGGSGIERLVFVSRVSRTEKDNLFRLAEVFGDEDLKTGFQGVIQDVVLDRLVLAGSLLDQAKDLVSDPPSKEISEITYRTAISRAYYAAHHSIRAILLYHNGWDADRHESSIEELKEALKDKKFRDETGLAPGTDKEVIEARSNRHIADYSPYSIIRGTKGLREMLTGDSWKSAVEFNLALASKVYESADKFMGR